MSALVNFEPLCDPSFAWDVTDTYSTIQDVSSRGHRTTRPRRNIKLRSWEFQWINQTNAEKAYIRAFAEYHLGAAVAFCYPLPYSNLYTDGPAFNALTLAQSTGGSLADATYDVQYTFENTNGETLASPIQQIVIIPHCIDQSHLLSFQKIQVDILYRDLPAKKPFFCFKLCNGPLMATPTATNKRGLNPGNIRGFNPVVGYLTHSQAFNIE